MADEAAGLLLQTDGKRNLPIGQYWTRLKDKVKVRLTVPNQLHSYAPTTLARLNYLYPDLTFGLENTDIVIGNCPVDRETFIKRNVLYTLSPPKGFAGTTRNWPGR